MRRTSMLGAVLLVAGLGAVMPLDAQLPTETVLELAKSNVIPPGAYVVLYFDFGGDVEDVRDSIESDIPESVGNLYCLVRDASGLLEPSDKCPVAGLESDTSTDNPLILIGPYSHMRAIAKSEKFQGFQRLAKHVTVGTDEMPSPGSVAGAFLEWVRANSEDEPIAVVPIENTGGYQYLDVILSNGHVLGLHASEKSASEATVSWGYYESEPTLFAIRKGPELWQVVGEIDAFE